MKDQLLPSTYCHFYVNEVLFWIISITLPKLSAGECFMISIFLKIFATDMFSFVVTDYHRMQWRIQGLPAKVAKSYMKMKEIGPTTYVPWTPFGSANGVVQNSNEKANFSRAVVNSYALYIERFLVKSREVSWNFTRSVIPFVPNVTETT